MNTLIKKITTGIMIIALLTGIVLFGQPGVTVNAKTKLSKTKATICVGETLQLNLSGTKTKVTWKSAKKGVATVDKNGLVTGKKKGSCAIKASCGGKTYTCKLKVNDLPKNYATINGTKVKVGSKVKVKYTVSSNIPVADISVHYYYYDKQLEVLTSMVDAMRFKTWKCIKDGENVNPGKQKQREDFAQCWGINPKNPYDVNPYSISCKNGKEFDCFYVKALKHGNFTLKSKFTARDKGKDVKVTVKETIK